MRAKIEDKKRKRKETGFYSANTVCSYRGRLHKASIVRISQERETDQQMMVRNFHATANTICPRNSLYSVMRKCKCFKFYL